MSALFSKPKAPPAPPPAIKRNDPAIAEAAKKERQRVAALRGRGGTILTSGLGESDNGGKTLLGQ